MSADAIKLLKPKVFDKSKWMQLPRDVVIGHDVLGQLPAVCEDLKLGASALLISGKGTMNLAGSRFSRSFQRTTMSSPSLPNGSISLLSRTLKPLLRMWIS